ncbi:polysaccharide deacetylase family protein [Natroniella sulfidigena]|uniref:polysaccharide deacetylase family protein n=1 Tax=Natroniella sulfidigena TaxID=723921 RepID=UPI00200B56C5|nr:polysaccharide deacetylase family protein [Natroniella sulfidigena]MCK8816471.1 polysaccharide deacetylase family protein [Natroniella sulfidigena]
MILMLKAKDILILCVVLGFAFFLFGTVTREFVVQREEVMVSQDKLVPIYKVDREDKKIAITLDGMWGAERTPEILEIFEKHDLNITFFFGGNWLEENPQLIKEMVAKGHEIGNHSYTHPHMASLTKEEIKQELNQTEELIKKLTGEGSRLFRPPFGEYNNLLIETCEELGYYPVQWSIDSHDWMDVSSDYIVNRVLDNVGPGDIILMHNDGEKTPKSLSRLIPKLKEQGYEIVPLSELIYTEDYYIEKHTGLQKKIERGHEDG